VATVGVEIARCALVDEVDGCAHIEQVSVRPAFSRRGIGRRLVDRVDHWARERGLDGLTLTTFSDVPWNRPYYERLGFRVLNGGEVTAGLRRIVDAETAHGLDTERRACIRRSISRD